MSRESCISHKASGVVAIVRQDYYDLMGRDAVAAALLNIFEYWGNAAIANNPKDLSPNLGAHSIAEFQHLLLGISTDKQIRQRLRLLEDRGFIAIHANRFSGKSSTYQFFIKRVQEALDNLAQLSAIKAVGQITDLPRSNNRPTSVKQPTEPRSNNRPTSVKQPTEPRSFDHSSYIQEVFKEEEEDLLSETGVSDDRESPKTGKNKPDSESPCSQVATDDESPKKSKSGKEAGVPPAAKKAKKGKRRSKSTPSFCPEAFESWWASYYKFCLEVDQSAGRREEAVVIWDEILSEDLNLLAEIQEGTEWYVACKKRQFASKGEATAVSHGIRYLRDRKWREALDHKQAIGSVDNAGLPGWLKNLDQGFITWVSRYFLPDRPEYRGTEVKPAIAQSWLNDAKFSPKRMEQSSIAWEAYQDHLQQLKAAEQLRVAPAVDPVVPSDPETVKLRIQAIREAAYGSK